tara:strand:+ start:401 stop:679 length:279 start_codon:yes stop_codon:yes gene_type:complete
MDNVSVLSVNTTEVLKRFFKYLAEGLMVAIAAYVFPKKKMDADEIIMIAVVASATFAILDMYAPTIGATARQGAGFGIGATLVGFPGAGLAL